MIMTIPLSRYAGLLAAYLKPLRWQAALLALLLFSGAGLQLLNPQILAAFIDAIATGTTFTELTRLALLFLGVALISQLVTVAAVYQATHIGLAATNQLRADLTRHCLALDMSFHNRQTPGELIERVDGDVAHLANFFSRFAIDLLGSAILLLGVLVVLFQIDGRVGLALASFVLLTLFTLNRLRDIAVPHFRLAREASAALFGFLEERLAGTEDVRANGAVAYVMRRFYERARELFRRQLRAVLMATGAFGLANVLFSLGVILALGLGAYLFQTGLITIGVVYLIFRYTELLTRPIQQINHQIQDLQRAGAAIVRIQDLLAVQSQLRESGQAGLPDGALAVTFEAVSFSYLPANGQSQPPELALEDISFELPPGATLGLLGRTGSGKTTLTRLLFRFYDPSRGLIRLNGLPLADIDTAALRRQVGLVTQDIQLFHASLRDNLTLFDRAIPDARIGQVLHEVGLGRWYAALPDGLETPLAPGSAGLSAGEAQLLAFVRVFLKDPGLVVLDEASSRLDPATEQLLERAVDRLLAGRSAIIIAHRLATVRRADFIMILERGRCVEVGPRRQLAADPRSRFAGLLQTGLEEALA
jgi:ABC-type multidrug transport system fused ATPase/permease subunit